MRLKELARQGFKSVSRGYPGGSGFGGSFWGRTSPSGRDWNQEAGIRYDNSIVYAAIQYACNAMCEVDLYVRRPKADGTYEEVFDHPATKLLAEPTPWYDGMALMSGQVISELAGPGSSYTFKHRSSAGRLIGLEYIPHFAIRPYVAPGSGNFIDHYRLTISGGHREIPVQNIFQSRFGPINPLRPQESIGPIWAALMEVVTDKEAANFTAALLVNTGVTPHLISPALKDSEGNEIIFGDSQIEQIKQVFEEKITGDNRGRPIIMPLPIKVDSLSFSPSDMNLEAIRNLSEERICAALGIPPLVLNLGTGLENTNNRASADAAARAAARSFVKPYMRKKAAQLTRDLIPELGEPGEQICFRMEAIEALQDDKTEAAKRKQIACGGPWKTVNEIRTEEGDKPIEGGDELRQGPGAQDDPKDKRDKQDD
jgi:HK97 family phage portal protein